MLQARLCNKKTKSHTNGREARQINELIVSVCEIDRERREIVRETAIESRKHREIKNNRLIEAVCANI